MRMRVPMVLWLHQHVQHVRQFFHIPCTPRHHTYACACMAVVRLTYAGATTTRHVMSIATSIICQCCKGTTCMAHQQCTSSSLHVNPCDYVLPPAQTTTKPSTSACALSCNPSSNMACFDPSRQAGYVVIFLHRKGSVQPFTQELPAQDTMEVLMTCLDVSEVSYVLVLCFRCKHAAVGHIGRWQGSAGDGLGHSGRRLGLSLPVEVSSSLTGIRCTWLTDPHEVHSMSGCPCALHHTPYTAAHHDPV